MTGPNVHDISTAEIHDVRGVIDALAADGIVLVPGYLDDDAVGAARRECIELFGRTPPWAHHEEYSVGQSVRMEREDVDPTAFPTVLSAFSRPDLEAAATAFFGDDVLFSRTIYAILDVVGSTTRVQEPHYDKMRHLKSFVYLTDVGEDNGPFHCVPGSHLLTQRIEQENRSRRIIPDDHDSRDLPNEVAGRAVPVLSSAGTLILFDSDIMHHAGVVRSGERLAIRSLSFGAYRSEDWFLKDGTVMAPGTPTDVRPARPR